VSFGSRRDGLYTRLNAKKKSLNWTKIIQRTQISLSLALNLSLSFFFFFWIFFIAKKINYLSRPGWIFEISVVLVDKDSFPLINRTH
jgi:hypothetical protein